MNGSGQEGTGGFGQAGKQCLRSIIYSWMPRRKASSWQRAARCGWPDSCLSAVFKGIMEKAAWHMCPWGQPPLCCHLRGTLPDL